MFNLVVQAAETHAVSLHRVVRTALNVGLLGLWLWFYRPVFSYLTIIFSREDFRTNQILLIGVVILILLRMRDGVFRPRLDAAPQLVPAALALMLAGALLYLAVERYLDINTLSASLFGIASYGMLGLWMRPHLWRQGLPAVLLLIGTLPFGDHLQTFVGYPMRILTAGMVQDGLRTIGIHSISIDTILVLENGVSQIDLPCSGVKSLWTGMLFLVAATWIERRPINTRWMGVAIVFIILLFSANLARVAVLVLVGQVAGWQLAAEMLHVPLGVLGFAAACTVAVGLLQLQRPMPKIAASESAAFDAVATTVSPNENPFSTADLMPPLARPAWLAPALALFLLALILVYVPRPQTGLAQPPPDWFFPAEIVTEPLPLTPDEVEWMIRGGAESADRHRFAWHGITGSMIFVPSTTWRAHHRPERCFEVQGLSIDDTRPHLIGADFPLRVVSLSRGDQQKRLAAVYWYQTVDRTTDDYATRIWADLALERERWILVSVLFDDVQDPRATELQPFYVALHETVAHTLEGR
jgi:exosortase O